MQPLISRLIRQVAYEIIRATGELPPLLPEIRHAPVLPANSTYSPWLSDSYFQVATERVWGLAPIDQLRCYELWSLVRQSEKLGRGALMEVGNWRGDTGCLIAQAAAHFGIPDRVYLCDKLAAGGSTDASRKSDQGRATAEDIMEGLVTRLRLGNAEVVHPRLPDETVFKTAEPALRFVHFAAGIDEHITDILEYLWPRLVSGGLVVFEHYGTHGQANLTRLVNQLALLGDRLFVHNLNGHGVFIKR